TARPRGTCIGCEPLFGVGRHFRSILAASILGSRRRRRSGDGGHWRNRRDFYRGRNRSVSVGARPREVVGAAGRSAKSVAAAQNARRDRIGACRCRTIVGAKKLAALDGIVIERNDPAYGRSCSGTFGIWLVRTRDGHRNAALQRAAHVVLDIVRELLRPVLGEMRP